MSEDMTERRVTADHFETVQYIIEQGLGVSIDISEAGIVTLTVNNGALKYIQAHHKSQIGIMLAQAFYYASVIQYEPKEEQRRWIQEQKALYP